MRGLYSHRCICMAGLTALVSELQLNPTPHPSKPSDDSNRNRYRRGKMEKFHSDAADGVRKGQVVGYLVISPLQG